MEEPKIIKIIDKIPAKSYSKYFESKLYPEGTKIITKLRCNVLAIFKCDWFPKYSSYDFGFFTITAKYCFVRFIINHAFASTLLLLD